MEAAKRKRRLIRRNFNMLQESLESLLEEESINTEQVEVKFKLLMQTSQTLMEEDANVLELMMASKLTEDEENQEFDEMSLYKEKAESMKMKKERLVPSVVSNSEMSNSSCVVAEVKHRNFKLPPVHLKKFDGKIEEWLGFWSQFEKIHKDETLHDSDKFHYLVQSFGPESEPYEIAQGYPHSAENYPKLVEALIKRYGNENKQLQVHLRKLLLLVTSNVRSAEKIPVDKLFHKLTACLGSLKSLNLKKAEPDSWLYPLVESSLPDNVLYNWEHNAMSMHDGSLDSPPRTKLELLMCFLEREVDIRQKI